jgi:hypothetical protein
MSDIEFFHAGLLDPEQTVEASALMKNDRIGVFPNRKAERARHTEDVRLQRESDRKYFEDLRGLLPNPNIDGSSMSGCDVILDCQGKVVDGRGYSQNVLATTVRAHSVLIIKRCKWLGRMIVDAREDKHRRAEMTIPSDKSDKSFENDDENGVQDNSNAISQDGMKSGQSDDDDDIIMAEGPRAGDNVGNNINIAAGGEGGNAAKVEDYDDDDDDDNAKSASEGGLGERKKMASEDALSLFPNLVWIPLNHPPQAVKLLLEYCYTNRVQSLGKEAFTMAGRTSSTDSGPVPPFAFVWPDGGTPTVSLHLALAGIALAEEAHLPRFSLMCEVAASQLVDNHNVIDVLSACHVQQQKTGNCLPILRRAAILDCIMANGSGGVDQLYANPTFKSSLHERRGIVIPSLLDGTVEVMPSNMNTKEIQRKKDRMAIEKRKMMELTDNSDKNKRIFERIKWKNKAVVTRRIEDAFGPDSSRDMTLPLSKDKIWRDSTYQCPTPPLALPTNSNQQSGSSSGRGTKRTRSAASGGDGGSGNSTTTERTRQVRNRQTKRK